VAGVRAVAGHDKSRVSGVFHDCIGLSDELDLQVSIDLGGALFGVQELFRCSRQKGQLIVFLLRHGWLVSCNL
jgi:hypothetical protein